VSTAHGTTGAGAAPAVSARSRPNIVVFMLDDLDALTMPYWDALPETRRLIKDTGRTFVNNFSTAQRPP